MTPSPFPPDCFSDESIIWNSYLVNFKMYLFPFSVVGNIPNISVATLFIETPLSTISMGAFIFIFHNYQYTSVHWLVIQACKSFAISEQLFFLHQDGQLYWHHDKTQTQFFGWSALFLSGGWSSGHRLVFS